MNMNDYQAQARETFLLANHDVAQLYLALGSCGESGEAAEKIKKAIRNKLIKDPHASLTLNSSDCDLALIKKELGDQLWYIANLAEEFGWTLEDVAQTNLSKLLDRKDRGVVNGEGDVR